MSSSWNEHLCIEAVSGKKFQLSTCTREWIGPIHALKGNSKLFDKDGNLAVPEFWGKKRIVGIADMEYLETENLMVNDDSELSLPFNADNINDAREFCEEQAWVSEYGFNDAWMKIETLVKYLNIKAPITGDGEDAAIQLISRQEVSSSYDEYLFLMKIGVDEFVLQRRVHDSVGPIQNIPQRNKFFSPSGQRIKPKIFEGSKILGYVDLDGLGGDNSYAYLERIVQTPLDQDVFSFSASQLAVAKDFCTANGWDSSDGFNEAWKKVKAKVKGTKTHKPTVRPKDKPNPLAFTKQPAVVIHSTEGTNAVLDWLDFIVVTRSEVGKYSVYARKYGWNSIGNKEKETWIPVERVSGINTPQRFVSAVKSCEEALTIEVDWPMVFRSLSSLDNEFSKRVRTVLES